jgi:osmotically inducible lipoprotein OsmB
MNTTPSLRMLSAIGMTALVTLAGCAGMDRSERATATGAVVGGVAGAVITNSAVGTAAGAAIGGVVGHEVEKKKGN